MYQKTIKDRVVGIDISKLTTTYAIVDIRGNILAKDQFPTVDYPDVNDYVAVLSEKLVTFMLENDAIDKVRSVGISAPSGNFKTGCMENSPNMPWKGVIPLAAMLRDRLGLAVAVANDGHVIGLGEQQYGSAHGLSDFAIVTIGHGLGCSVFSNKMPHLGSNGFAGEFGHVIVERNNGRACGCGRRGCLETYVSATGIKRTAFELMAKMTDPSELRDISFNDFDASMISAAAAKGDPVALETFRYTGEMLGRALADAVVISSPKAIFLFGGLAKAGKFLFEPTKWYMEENMLSVFKNKVEILPSGIEGKNAAILGSAALIWQKQHA